jgi:acetoacetate decarboxylase
MKKGSFFVPQEELKNFIRRSEMNTQEGLYISWMTKPEVVQKVLPPQLKMVAPIVSVYIVNIQEPTFTARYLEGAISIPVICNGKQGLYCLSLMLSGPGSEMGTYAGREVSGIPKKLCDGISVERIDNYAHAYIERHGIRIIDVEVEIGEYNSPQAKNVFSNQGPGTVVPSYAFFYKYDVGKNEKGEMAFSNGRLNASQTVITYKTWEPATAKVILQPSLEDPWAELEVVEVLGAGYSQNSTALTNVELVEEINAGEIMSYLFSGRFDRGILCSPERHF